MKPVELTIKQWDTLWKRLKEDNPPSVFLIRERMRQRLGFVQRNHKEWVENPKAEYAWDQGHYDEKVMLDFYDERKRTMFLLKYSEIINDEARRTTV